MVVVYAYTAHLVTMGVIMRSVSALALLVASALPVHGFGAMRVAGYRTCASQRSPPHPSGSPLSGATVLRHPPWVPQCTSCADAPLIGEDPRAPVEVDEQLICEACLAIVDHTMTELKKKGKVKNMEIAISGILDAACDQKNMEHFNSSRRRWSRDVSPS